MNGRRDSFTHDDFRTCANSALLKRGRAEQIVAEVTAEVSRWLGFAEAAGVPEELAGQIFATLRLDLRRA